MIGAKILRYFSFPEIVHRKPKVALQFPIKVHIFVKVNAIRCSTHKTTQDFNAIF